MNFRLKTLLVGGAMAVAAALTLSAPAQAAGVLRDATVSEPAPIDPMLTTADVVSTISLHIYETLYAINGAFEPQPMLATGERIEDDGKTIVISLREGVLFHNGEELTAEDVVASLKRWGEFGVRGKLLMANATSLEATGPYEVTLKLSTPNGAWKNLLANIDGGPAIYPAEVANAAGGEPIPQEGYIGTGPYKFNEWRPNRYVEIVRFDGYKSRDEAPDGFAGGKVANFDAIQFIPVPDAGTRISGVQAGDYDYADLIPGDLYEQLAADSSVVIHRRGVPAFGLFFVNNKDGIFKDNFDLRRAVNTALDKTAALQVSFGPEGLWDDAGSIYPSGNYWHSEAGTEFYNQADPAKAKEMAAAAGYDGTPIRILVSTNYQFHYDQAAVFAKQLADAGINTQLVVVDWATLLKLRGEADKWDIFVTHHGLVPDPALVNILNPNYPGWWSTPEATALIAEFNGTTDQAARKASWDKLQALIYEQLPAIKVGDGYSYDIMSPKLNGMGEQTVSSPHFWNASF